MLDVETNRKFSETDAGTPMGSLLRYYWHPIGSVYEMNRRPTKSIRIMGEDLVLYRDLSGNYGLVDKHCPHRRADLAFGFVEAGGLRCSYHGWLYDEMGACIEQPFEDTVDANSNFKNKIKIKAYPVESKGGLLWAYLGQKPAPLLPTWEPFTWDNGFSQIVFSKVPCNWFQGQENSIDPVHFEWQHANWRIRASGKTKPYSPKHLKIDFQDFDYGISYKRIREDTDETHPLWTVGRNCLWPNALFTGDHFEWRVPIDDTNMLSVGWFFNPIIKDQRPYTQKEIPSWEGPVFNQETGEWITSHVMNQDFAAWVGQGEIANRTKEHLARSDRGVILMRKRFLDDLEKIKDGKDPSGLIRNEKLNTCVELPIFDREFFLDGPTREQLEDIDHPRTRSMLNFVFQAGQPNDIRQAYVEAMGF